MLVGALFKKFGLFLNTPRAYFTYSLEQSPEGANGFSASRFLSDFVHAHSEQYHTSDLSELHMTHSVANKLYSLNC
jgi:hypothetical protein